MRCLSLAGGGWEGGWYEQGHKQRGDAVRTGLSAAERGSLIRKARGELTGAPPSAAQHPCTCKPLTYSDSSLARFPAHLHGRLAHLSVLHQPYDLTQHGLGANLEGGKAER